MVLLYLQWVDNEDKPNMNLSNLMDTPRLLPQPPLFSEGLRPETTLPLKQEGDGGCVMALYYYIFVRSPIAANTHNRNDRYSFNPY